MDFRKVSKKRKFNSSKSLNSSPSVVDYTLPIFSYKNELIECIRQHQTTIVIGETGSGKSTQLPQFLSEFYSTEEQRREGGGGCVVCTQPRRVAAVTIAERVANERNSPIGEEVGYSIRFNDRSGPLTKIKYVTDGVLLREIMTDPNLSRYSVVILDEAHERSLQTDILMGLLKQLQQTKPSLRSLILSLSLSHLLSASNLSMLSVGIESSSCQPLLRHKSLPIIFRFRTRL
jgi:HrpA-like RNA helicase